MDFSEELCVKVDGGDEFRFGSCDFVDRSLCPEEQPRSTKSHELNRRLVSIDKKGKPLITLLK